jgi:hypothetical protein
MSNDNVPAQIRGLKIGAQAVGALAVGALAIGALAIGAVTIGRLVIGRSRIRRLEIDELVVARLHVTDSLIAPSTAVVENDSAKKQKSKPFNQPATFDRAINKLFGLLVGLGLGLPHNYLLQGKEKWTGYFSVPWRTAAVLEARLCRELHVGSRPVASIIRARTMRLNKTMNVVRDSQTGISSLVFHFHATSPR